MDRSAATGYTGSMFRLAHLSDPHLAPLPRPTPVELAGKRITGYLNWHLHRSRRQMQPETTARLVADIAAHRPDHIAVTGDLVNIALSEEYRRAAGWLAGLGRPEDVSVVPGNHDAYVSGALEQAEALWRANLQGDALRPDGRTFPWVRRRAAIALVGVSSAVPTPPFFATGRIGLRQAEVLRQILTDLGREGLCRIVMIHHPPHPGSTTWIKRLTDAPLFLGVLAEAGAELVLHGHTHHEGLAWIEAAETGGSRREIAVVGVPSAARAVSSEKRGAGWNRFDISGHQGDWQIQLTERGFAAGGTEIDTIGLTDVSPR